MFAELVRFNDLNDDAIARWEELLRSQYGYESPFFHPHFARVVSGLRDDVYVVISGEGETINFFLPVQKSGRTAFPAGAPFADYHGPIMSGDWDGDIEDILKRVGLRGYKFTSLFDPRHRFSSYAVRRDGTFVCDLSCGADEFFETQRTLFPRHTKKMRRLARKVEREVGEIDFLFEDPDETAFATLLDWKSKQYRDTGRHDVLSPSWVQQMLRQLWKAGVPGCQGVFHTLRHKGRLIAGEFNLLSETTIHGWIPAFDHEFWSYSPGYLLQDEIIKVATLKGYKDYDLGVSSEHYKKYYANFQIPVESGTIKTKGLQSGIDGIGETVWNSVEDAHIPKVSALAGKIRRRYAMIRTVETSAADRLKGVASAATLLLRKDQNTKENLANSED